MKERVLFTMDPNIVAATISLVGSAALAGTGAIATWYKSKRRKKHMSVTYAKLYTHPVTQLEADRALEVMCHDTVKCNLLNAIRREVICIPTQNELKHLLGRLQRIQSIVDSETIGQSVSLVREQISREQEAAARKFPEATHTVISKLISTHAKSLAIASDLFHCSYSLAQTLELVFNIFYVSTFTVLSQWAQTANQLNGQLNGVWWNEKRIGYCFGGNVTDAIRILNPTVLLMHEALSTQDCCAVVVDRHDYILGCCGCEQCLGLSAGSLIGLPLAIFQFGVDDLSPREDLKTAIATDARESSSPSLHRFVRVKDKTGAIVHALVFSATVQLSLPTAQEVTVLLFVRSKEQTLEKVYEVEHQVIEDAHTRMAFMISTLTHPVRRIAVGCTMDAAYCPLVAATMDGSPDLPHFAVHKLMHTQMDIPQRRVCDACSRCDVKLQGDLLRASSLIYTWKNSQISAEFYIIGNDMNALMSIHRPLATELEADKPKTEQTGSKSAIARSYALSPRSNKHTSCMAFFRNKSVCDQDV